MDIQSQALQRVLAIGQDVARNAIGLHFADIAKAIEQKRGCQIFIQFIGAGQETGGYDGFTANVELYLASHGEKTDENQYEFIQHFIYCKQNDDQEVERFHLGRALGHCLLHWPLGPRKSRRIYASLPKLGRFYLVDYTNDEEKEADFFSCFLATWWPDCQIPTGEPLNSAIREKSAEYAARGLLISKQ